MSGLGLHSLAIGGHEYRGHETKRAKALSDGIRLHITIVVLACPDEATLYGKPSISFVFYDYGHIKNKTKQKQFDTLSLREKATMSSMRRCSYQMPASLN